MAKLHFSCGIQNGHTHEQAEFIRKVIELAKEYGEVTFKTEDVGVWGHDHKDTYSCEALELTVVSERDSS